MEDRSPIYAQLDRVGASFRKAGAAGYIISVQLGLDEVKLLGPPREHARRSWVGPQWPGARVARRTARGRGHSGGLARVVCRLVDRDPGYGDGLRSRVSTS